MKTFKTLFTVVLVGLFTLISCKQDTDLNTMMHNNGDYYNWGMHMGWWFFLLLIVIILIVLFYNSKKRK